MMPTRTSRARDRERITAQVSSEKSGFLMGEGIRTLLEEDGRIMAWRVKNLGQTQDLQKVSGSRLEATLYATTTGSRAWAHAATRVEMRPAAQHVWV